MFLSWWGLILLGAIDASIAFVAPFGVDAAVVYLAARDERFWLVPLAATTGSLTGAAVTYWIGRRIGAAGLERVVRRQTLDRIRKTVETKGAYAIAIPALLPPPVPLKPFLLTSGALGVEPVRFFLTFGTARLLRFGGETVLARMYGDWLLRVFQSDAFQITVLAFVGVALLATVVSGLVLWRKLRTH